MRVCYQYTLLSVQRLQAEVRLQSEVDTTRPCASCHIRPRKHQRTLCQACASARERPRQNTPERQAYRRDYKRALRRAAGKPTRDEISARRDALADVRERKRAERKANKVARAKTTPVERKAQRALRDRLRRQTDPEYRRYHILKAFARKRRLRGAADGTVTPKSLSALTAATRKCYLCAAPLNGSATSFDHVIPIAAGGVHGMSNLAVVHLSCNLHKRTRIVTLC